MAMGNRQFAFIVIHSVVFLAALGDERVRHVEEMSNFFVTQSSQETEWITMKANCLLPMATLATPLPCRAWHALLFQ